jgi:hypothetical protein
MVVKGVYHGKPVKTPFFFDSIPHPNPVGCEFPFAIARRLGYK